MALLFKATMRMPSPVLLLFASVAAAAVRSTPLRWDALEPRTTPRTVELHNLWAHQVPYKDALRAQRQLLAHRVAAVAERRPMLPDVVLLMQHPPVLTLGTRRWAALSPARAVAAALTV